MARLLTSICIVTMLVSVVANLDVAVVHDLVCLIVV